MISVIRRQKKPKREQCTIFSLEERNKNKNVIKRKHNPFAIVSSNERKKNLWLQKPTIKMNAKKTTTENCVARRKISRSSSKHTLSSVSYLKAIFICIKFYKYAKSWFLFLPFQKSSVHVYIQNNSKYFFCHLHFALSQTEYPLKFLIALLISIQSCIFLSLLFHSFLFLFGMSINMTNSFQQYANAPNKSIMYKLLQKILFTSRPLIFFLFFVHFISRHLKLKSFIIMSMYMGGSVLFVCMQSVCLF